MADGGRFFEIESYWFEFSHADLNRIDCVACRVISTLHVFVYKQFWTQSQSFSVYWLDSIWVKCELNLWNETISLNWLQTHALASYRILNFGAKATTAFVIKWNDVWPWQWIWSWKDMKQASTSIIEAIWLLIYMKGDCSFKNYQSRIVEVEMNWSAKLLQMPRVLYTLWSGINYKWRARWRTESCKISKKPRLITKSIN